MKEITTSIKTSYEKITPFFYGFSRLFESTARIKSHELSGIQNGKSVLIIAPPTEYYLETLFQSNPDGENHIICFSSSMKQRIEGRLRNKYIFTAKIGRVEKLPGETNQFDVVFAFCYLDFLDDNDRGIAVKEIKRILKPNGRLLATYLSKPQNQIERSIIYLFTKIKFLSKGVRVIEVQPDLVEAEFKNVKPFYCPQKGFPIGLIYAEK